MNIAVPTACPVCLSAHLSVSLSVCLPCTQGLFMESNVTHATPSDSFLPGLLTAHTSLTFSTTLACVHTHTHTHTHIHTHDMLPINPVQDDADKWLYSSTLYVCIYTSGILDVQSEGIWKNKLNTRGFMDILLYLQVYNKSRHPNMCKKLQLQLPSICNLDYYFRIFFQSIAKNMCTIVSRFFRSPPVIFT